MTETTVITGISLSNFSLRIRSSSKKQRKIKQNETQSDNVRKFKALTLKKKTTTTTKNNLDWPSSVFIAQVLAEPGKQLKQIIGQIIEIEHNIVRNPNWPEANQLAIYKRGRGFDEGATEKQIQVVIRAGLEPGTAGLQVRHADHLATLPPPRCKLLEKWITVFAG